MTTQVRILSGLGDKAPAALLIEHKGFTLLLDAGGPLESHESCDWYHSITPDVILLSHDHVDHIAGVKWLGSEIPLYCTPTVAKRLPAGRAWHPLPSQGSIDIKGIQVTTGLSGHSLEGIWIHLGIAGGIFYSGDFSLESLIYPFDPPPKAELALLDASYGLYDREQPLCRQDLLQHLHSATLLPVPASGRALELAIWCQRLDLPWTLDPQCQDYFGLLRDLPKHLFKPGVLDHLDALTPEPWTPEPWECQASGGKPLIRLAGDADGVGGEAGRLISDPKYSGQVIYTGYMPSKAREDVRLERAHWVRWNVHPRSSCIAMLTESLQAQRVVPLFCSLDLPGWQILLGDRLETASVIHC